MINRHKTSFKAPIQTMSKTKASSKQQQRICKALCCSSCRLSLSSSCSEEVASSRSDRYPSISSLSHAMVQERLDQMIREGQEGSRHVDHRRRKQRAGDDHDQLQAGGGTKFVVMVAMEKCSYDPREDFRESMAAMIMENQIEEPKDLRSLLNYYVSMNSDEYRGLILEVFHEVCSEIFLCKFH